MPSRRDMRGGGGQRRGGSPSGGGGPRYRGGPGSRYSPPSPGGSMGGPRYNPPSPRGHMGGPSHFGGPHRPPRPYRGGRNGGCLSSVILLALIVGGIILFLVLRGG